MLRSGDGEGKHTIHAGRFGRRVVVGSAAAEEPLQAQEMNEAYDQEAAEIVARSFTRSGDRVLRD